MAPKQKKNDFLDLDNSDDDQSQGYNSDADEVQKGGRSAKRRRLEVGDSEDPDLDSGSDSEPQSEPEDKKSTKAKAKSTSQRKSLDGEDQDDDADQSPPPSKSKPSEKPLKNKSLVASEAAIRKSGVLYVSRIPPFMKPHKLRTLLSPFGEINRTFLLQEDRTAHSRRVRAGGNKKKLYVEGWVEFVNKRDAKHAYEALNGQTLGGKKGSYYRDDIWSLVYLKGFKWRDLMSQVAAENAERESRMRAEIGKATRENKEFVANVERAKQEDGIRAKRDAKRKRSDGPSEDVEAVPDSAHVGDDKRTMRFKQIQQVEKGNRKSEDENVKRVLSKIF